MLRVTSAGRTVTGAASVARGGSREAGAQATVNESADKVCAELGVDNSRIDRQIAEGDPRWVLLSKSDISDLLVLGRRGRGGLPHFFLGSTTTALIHRPHCPTAVIPG